MNKAEELAEKVYPIGDTKLSDAAQSMCRNAFIKGYHQAEKDLELTWEDIEEIYLLVIEKDNAYMEANAQNDYQYDVKEMYQEVLKRFKYFKERKEK